MSQTTKKPNTREEIRADLRQFLLTTAPIISTIVTSKSKRPMMIVAAVIQNVFGNDELLKRLDKLLPLLSRYEYLTDSVVIYRFEEEEDIAHLLTAISPMLEAILENEGRSPIAVIMTVRKKLKKHPSFSKDVAQLMPLLEKYQDLIS